KLPNNWMLVQDIGWGSARASKQVVQDGVDLAACKATVVGGWRTNQHDQGCFGMKLTMPCRGGVETHGLPKNQVEVTT
ncbi:hypothetical protein, partial [Thioalkalivibrio sp.]|uniref:hypothetical protein n=1 Tax=Thioalkalivibrio sp. TaxID=2093813 RepID=UPI00356A02E7